METLKPCPFCGNPYLLVGTVADMEYQDETHEDYEINSHSYVVCCGFNNGGCGSSTGCHESADKAIEAWNRRADNG